MTAEVHAVSTTVVISEFRVRGPNGGSDEFVELYNLSSSPVTIGGWTLRGWSTAGVTIRATVPTGRVINPGCFYLFTNSNTTGGPYSGAVPGNTTYLSGFTDDAGIAITLSNGTVVDQVGMNALSTFKEGTVLPSLGMNNLNRGYERKPGGLGGHADTDNNFNDFQLISPSSPQNASSPCLSQTNPTIDGSVAPNPVVQFQPLLVTGSVTPGMNPASTGLFAFADLTSLGGAAQQALVDDGSNGDAVANDKIYSYQLPAVTSAAGTYSISLQVGDGQNRSGSDSVSVTVLSPIVIRLPHDIQGPGLVSPFLGQVVTVEGVVTGRRSNGFFMQTAPGSEDGNPSTSEGLFVFTASAPPAEASVGALLRVTGSVTEFSGDGSPSTLTEIVGPSHVVRGTSPVPAVVLLSPAMVSPAGGLDQLEHLEGMVVGLESLSTVSGTDGFFTSATGGESSGVITSSGVFYAVFSGTPRPAREPGIGVTRWSSFQNSCASGPPCAIPVFDTNPERFRVDSDALGAPALDVTTGVAIQNLTAIVDSGFATWGLLPVPGAAAPIVGVNDTPDVVATPTAEQFTVASMNLQRLFNAVADPGVGDVVLTPLNYANKLAKASLVLRSGMKMPDVVAVQEAENLSTLQALAQQVNSDSGMPGEYTAYLEEGNDPTGLDVGFLVRSRVHVTSVVQEGAAATFVDPDDGSVDVLNDRPPLVLRASIDGPPTKLNANVIVVANHLRSLDGVDSTTSGRVREKRRRQAEYLATLMNTLQTEGAVISVGLYNAFDVNDGFVDALNTVMGTPTPANQVVLASPDLVEPNFANAAAGGYSVVFEGNSETVDHAVLSLGAQAMFVGLQHARVNADFPEVYRSDSGRLERQSDHDPLVAYFAFPADTTPPTIARVTPSVTTLWPANHEMVAVTLQVEASDNRELTTCRIASVASNEPELGLGDGDTAPDSSVDGPLSLMLRAERSGAGTGRVYTIGVSCQDVAGNSSVATTDVSVPHAPAGGVEILKKKPRK